MDYSIFYAKLIGIYCIIVAIAMLINARTFKFILNDFIQNKSLIVFMGIVSLLFGLVIVLTHNIWSGWPILITVMGYLALLKGVVRLCFTDKVAQFVPRYAQDKPYYALCSTVLVIGVVLVYFGFKSF